MGVLPEAALAYIGVETPPQEACDAVERGAIRRHAQAEMHENPVYWDDCEENARYGGPVAPPLFPINMFRRAFGTPDPLSERAGDPDFDGLGVTSTQGLPPIEPLNGYSLLNGGSEIELFAYARVGDRVVVRSRYIDISERETSKGPIILVRIESEYLAQPDDRLLLRLVRTQIRRPTK